MPELRDMIEAEGGLLTRPLAAKALGYSRQHFYALFHEPDFPEPVCKVGEMALYSVQELTGWLEAYKSRQRLSDVPWRHRRIPRALDLDSGTPIVFRPTAGHVLGVLTGPPGEGGFSDHLVKSGDPGTYWGPHPSLPHWHVATLELDGQTLWVPLTRNHFYVAEEG
jgi:predicted DNA-binding transcriptional regulator AlpA